MTDEEVGELWDIYRKFGIEWPRSDGGEVVRLIRKLVEERAGIYIEAHGCNDCGEHIGEALDDFGIDPATWKE